MNGVSPPILVPPPPFFHFLLVHIFPFIFPTISLSMVLVLSILNCFSVSPIFNNILERNNVGNYTINRWDWWSLSDSYWVYSYEVGYVWILNKTRMIIFFCKAFCRPHVKKCSFFYFNQEYRNRKAISRHLLVRPFKFKTWYGMRKEVRIHLYAGLNWLKYLRFIYMQKIIIFFLMKKRLSEG